jgi:arsenical pump membrane protein
VTAIAVVALLAALAAAVVRDRRAPEALVALGGAVVVLAVGALTPAQAWDEAKALGPTLGLLAALLVLGDACERAGLFDALAAVMARASRGSGPRLLAVVVAVAAAVTAVLGLDATVVLLTPAALVAAARAGLAAAPAVYACTHLANAGSLLLPVSNLTNLLAFRAAHVSFLRFAGLMALPWLVAVAVEWAALRRFFAADLAAPARRGVGAARDEAVGARDEAAGAARDEAVGAREDAPRDLPRTPLAVLAGTLAGFAVSGPLGIDPAWVAAAGALGLAAPQLRRGALTAGGLVRAVDLPLLGFVLGLGVIVRAVTGGGVGDAIDSLVPAGHGLLALLGAAAVAAVLANLVNNLPALLVLLPAAAAAGPATVLAVLIGVDVGPNLTYTGSLATLLWRRVLHERGSPPDLGAFLRLGLVTVPPILAGATVALWLAEKLL